MKTWLDSEEKAYPRGGFTRKGKAILVRNPWNPIELPYGELVSVRASIPDTYFSIPAKIKVLGRTLIGYLRINQEEYEWLPEGIQPEACLECHEHEGEMYPSHFGSKLCATPRPHCTCDYCF